MSVQSKVPISPKLDTGEISVPEMETAECQDSLLLASRIARITYAVGQTGFCGADLHLTRIADTSVTVNTLFDQARMNVYSTLDMLETKT